MTKEEIKQQTDAIKHDIEYRRARIRDMKGKIVALEDHIAKENTEVEILIAKLVKLSTQ